jgi:TRAP-type C4-dicarboxylate transport system permease small subunit
MFLLEGIAFVGRGATLVATALPVGMGWVYSIVPVSLAALLLVSVEAVLRLLHDLLAGEAGREPLVGVVPLLEREPQD